MAEDLISCPFDPVHQIIRHRMPYHMIKCKKNYKGPPLDACPFNAMHLVTREQMKTHLETCRDYHTCRREVYEKQYEELKLRNDSEAGSCKSFH